MAMSPCSTTARPIPTSNVPQNNARGNGNSDYATMGGQNVIAGRVALRYTPSDQLEINFSADYTRERSEAIPTVLIAAGAVAAGCTPSIPTRSAIRARPRTSAWNPWLVGKNGQPVNMSCAFVPAGQYSCDTGGDLRGWDPAFRQLFELPRWHGAVRHGSVQALFRAAADRLPGLGRDGQRELRLQRQLELVYIGSYREYNSKFGQDQDATPLPVSQLDNELNHHAFTSELRLNFEDRRRFPRRHRRRASISTRRASTPRAST